MSDFIQNLAITIGINNYTNGISPLTNARPDALKLADIMETEHHYQEVIRITDENEAATKEKLIQLLKTTLPQKNLTESDRLLFYFAGHGVAINGDDGPAGYLVPQDADLKSNDSLIPMTTLYEHLKSLQCGHLLVILDCCFAGTFRWSSTRRLNPPVSIITKAHYDRFINSPAWQVITSAAYNQEAFDFIRDNRGMGKDKQHSPFAEALFAALRGDADIMPPARDNKPAGDGIITATELYLYLRDAVERQSKDMQTPGIWTLPKHERGEYIFLTPERGLDLADTPELNPDNNPYRGLEPFEEKHSRFFFGRQELIAELAHRLNQEYHRLTVVLGASGSGKSSLVKAGLIPYLRQEEEHQWEIIASMRPGEYPFTALAKSVWAISDYLPITEATSLDFISECLVNYLSQNDEQEIKALEQNWSDALVWQKLLLISDRFSDFKKVCQNAQSEAQLNNLRNRVKQSLQQLIDDLSSNPQKLVEIINNWTQTNPQIQLLLVIDQFEELITLTRQTDTETKIKTWQSFLNLLATTLNARPQFHLIVTLRSDFETRFLDSALTHYWSKARFPVRPMVSSELREAIERPASERALYFDPPNLVDRLIDEVGQTPGALPLLSFTLSELYLKLTKTWDETQDRALTIDEEFERQGGVAGALTNRANQEYDNLGYEKLQATMRRVMLRMISFEGWEVARRQVPDSELVYSDDAENKRVKLVIERLVNTRLVVRGQGTEEPYVEPAHDELIQGWIKFREWIDQESKINILLQRDLNQSARRWYAKEKSPRYLWTHDPRLFQAMRLLRSEDKERIWFNKLERDFLEQSIKSYDDLETQLDKERKLRVISEVRQKATEAEFLLSQGSEQALPKAIEAFGLNRNKFQDSIILGEVQTVLRKLADNHNQTHNLLSIFHHEQAVTSLAFCPSGKSLATACKDYIIRIWDTVNHTVDKTLEGHREAIISLTFDPTGKYLASSGKDGVFLWDLQLEVPLYMDTGTLDCIESLSFNNNGNLVVGGGSEGFIYIWNISKVRNHSANLEDYQHIHLNYHPAHIAKITSIAFSHDGKYLASGSQDQLIKLWELNFEGELIKLPNIFLKPTVPFFKSDYVSIIESNTFPSEKSEQFVGKESPSLYCLSELDDRPFIVELSSNQYDEVGARKVIGITLKGNQYAPRIDIYGKVKGNPFCGDDPDPLSHFEPISSLAFSPDDRLIASASLDGMIRLWSIDGIPLGQPFENDHVPISAIAFSPDGQNIVSGDHNGEVKIWSLDGYIIGSPYKAFNDPIKSLAFSPNGKDIASASAHDGTVKLYPGGLYFWLSSCCDLLLENAKFPQIYDDKKACVICEKEKARHQLNLKNIKGAEKSAQSIRFYENLNTFNLGVDPFKYVQMEIALLLYNQATLLAEQGKSEDAKAKLNKVMKIMPLELFVSYASEEIAHYKTNTRLLYFEPEDIEHIFSTDKLIDYIEANPFPLGLNRNISEEKVFEFKCYYWSLLEERG